jgi:hypothetical protein
MLRNSAPYQKHVGGSGALQCAGCRESPEQVSSSWQGGQTLEVSQPPGRVRRKVLYA